MAGSRINRFIIGMVLMALAGSFFTGADVLTSGSALAADSHCTCTSPAHCANCGSEAPSACMDMPASSGCRCSISSAPDTTETPAVVPTASHQLGIDILVATLPEQAKLVEGPQQTWVVTPEQIIYAFLFSSSPDGRAPPV